MNIVVMADHSIGHRLCTFLLQNSNGHKFRFYTTQSNDGNWWPTIRHAVELFGEKVAVYKDEESLLQDLAQSDLDLILLISWKNLVSDAVLNLPRLGCYNLHYSLLPRHRGVYPVNWAIINGDDRTGVTYHRVSTKIDGGDILAQKSLAIGPSESVDSLLERMDNLAFEMFTGLWPVAQAWATQLTPQTKNNDPYNSLRKYRASNKLDLDQEFTAKKLINLIRGKTFQGKSSLYFEKDGEKVFLSMNLRPENSDE